MASKKNDLPSSHNSGSSGWGVAKNIFGTIGRVFVTFFFVCVITGCIVAAVLTVYVFKYINSDNGVDLSAVDLNYTTILYAYDKNTGEPYELQRIHQEENRIWVDYDKIPKHVVNAAIAIEDKRYLQHQGVDWIRTFGSFINQFIPIYSSNAGGSTITQQVVRNITGDNAPRVDRKVREIFRALNLEKQYSKDQIMESYLNTVNFGGNTNGIQAAANLYFDKDVSELTIAEGAAIVGITQSPTYYNPFLNPENNKTRRDHIMWEMHDQGLITDAEYEKAKNQEVVFVRGGGTQKVNTDQSWFVDHVIEEVLDDLVNVAGYTETKAAQLLFSGGLRIYTTVDEEMQNYLNDAFTNFDNYPKLRNQEMPEAAMVITDVNGKILAMMGSNRPKETNRGWNIATMSRRHPGSSIKPIGPYVLSVENDSITYSTVLVDEPLEIVDNGKTIKWPTNESNTYTGPMTIDTALRNSINTISAKLTEALGPRTIFDFLKNKLNMYSLVEREVTADGVITDITRSSMALGGMAYGVTPLEMAGAYQIFANGGTFTSPYSYYKVLDSQGNVILEKDTTPQRVISFETATVMNKLLQRVVEAGTGNQVKMDGMPTGGKTGTSTNRRDTWFVGFTPYYVASVWMGYETGNVAVDYSGYYFPPPILWRNMMKPLHQGLEIKQFPASSNVVSMTYCTETGDIATEYCPSTATGWYKSSNIPGTCVKHLTGSSSSSGNDDDDDRPSWWD